MPNLNIMNPLNPTGISGYVTEADKIAYNTTTTTDGDGAEIQVLEKSVKSILDDLTLGETTILQAASLVRSDKDSISIMKTSIESQFLDNVQLMELKKADFNTNVESLNTKLNSVLDTANTLKYAFNTGTDFAVISLSDYDQLGNNVQNNVIYFIYD